MLFAATGMKNIMIGEQLQLSRTSARAVAAALA